MYVYLALGGIDFDMANSLAVRFPVKSFMKFL